MLPFDERPTFSFVQYVNDPAGYCWVKCEDEISEALFDRFMPIDHADPDSGEIDDADDSELIEDAPVSIIGEAISLEDADALWRDGCEALLIVESPPAQHQAESVTHRSYEPLQHFRGLFRTFSEIDPTPSGIVGFIERFGFLADLGETDDGFFELIVPELYGSDQPVHGESVGFWGEEINLMRHTIKLWDLISDRDEEKLSQHIKWNKGEIEYWSDFDGLFEEFRLLHKIKRNNVEIFGFLEGEILNPARFFCSVHVNDGLSGRVGPQLTQIPPNFEPKLEIMPTDLLGALWLQLAQTVDGNREYRACENCGTWFEIGSGAYSRARRFCSNKCRVAASRARKRAEEGGVQ